MTAKGLTLIGVTGGIGSGKSTVSAVFKKMGASVLDADEIAKSFLDKPVVRKRLVTVFGRDILSGKRIDRRKLAGRVYCDKKSLSCLARLVHPLTIGSIEERIRQKKRGLMVVDAALLIESGIYKKMDYVILVKAPRDLRISRLVKKGFTKPDVQRRMRFQMPESKKQRYSDFIIDNAGTVAQTINKVIKTLSLINEKNKRRIKHG